MIGLLLAGAVACIGHDPIPAQVNAGWEAILQQSLNKVHTVQTRYLEDYLKHAQTHQPRFRAGAGAPIKDPAHDRSPTPAPGAESGAGERAGAATPQSLPERGPSMSNGPLLVPSRPPAPAAEPAPLDNQLVAAFRDSLVGKTSSPADVAAITRMLSLPADEERQVNIKGFDAVKAFAASDPFFAGAGENEKLSYDFLQGVTRIARTCERKGNLFATTAAIADFNVKGEGTSLLGGLVSLENISKSTNLLDLGHTSSRIVFLESLNGQPFPLKPGKRFGLRFSTLRQISASGIADAQAHWQVTCGVSDQKVRGGSVIPDGAPQVVCLSTVEGEPGVRVQPVRRLYWDEHSGCLADTGLEPTKPTTRPEPKPPPEGRSFFKFALEGQFYAAGGNRSFGSFGASVFAGTEGPLTFGAGLEFGQSKSQQTSFLIGYKGPQYSVNSDPIFMVGVTNFGTTGSFGTNALSLGGSWVPVTGGLGFQIRFHFLDSHFSSSSVLSSLGLLYAF